LAVLALVIAAGAGLRVWGLRFGLPLDLARPDEEKISRAALGVAQGDLNPHFFLYPSLYIYLTAAAYAIVSPLERAFAASSARAPVVVGAVTDPVALRLVARGLSAAAGTATIAALYAAAGELFSARAALAAAVFLAVAFLAVRDSHFGVTDASTALMAVCAFWAAVRCQTKGITWRRVAVTGLLCGLTASTKYNAALIAAPAAVAIAGRTMTARARAPSALVPLALLSATLALGFVIGTPFAILDRPAFLADFTAQGRTALGEEHGSILDPAREVNGGERGWTHHFTFSLRYGLGLPLLIAAVAGACWLMADWSVPAAMTLSFPVAYYAAMGISVLVYARWMVPLVPFLCLMAGLFVDRASDFVGLLFRSTRAAALCAVSLVTAFATPTAASSVAFDRFVARTDARVVAARWIEDRFPSGATLYQTGVFYGHLQPRSSATYAAYGFDERRGVFIPPTASSAAAPELVVVLEAPLIIFNHVPDRLGSALEAHYEIVATFQGIGGPNASAADYDQQDAFYVPFARRPDARRPGPTVRIFRQRR
jgi:dolichyl-phosphate-mannose-protein mannosyltransferase